LIEIFSEYVVCRFTIVKKNVVVTIYIAN